MYMYSVHPTCFNVYGFMLVYKKIFFLVIKLAADFRGSTGFIMFKTTSSICCTKLGSLTLVNKEGKDKFERVSIEEGYHRLHCRFVLFPSNTPRRLWKGWETKSLLLRAKGIDE